MTFRDLQEALQRLSADPRIRPHTPVEIEVEVTCGSATWQENGRISAILVEGGHVTLTSAAREPALVRG